MTYLVSIHFSYTRKKTVIVRMDGILTLLFVRDKTYNFIKILE